MRVIIYVATLVLCGALVYWFWGYTGLAVFMLCLAILKALLEID